MRAKTQIWPVVGFEDSPLRKRLAFFRPWIEDKRVRFAGENPAAEAYVRTLAASVVEEGEADFVFAPSISPQVLSAEYALAQEIGCAFAGWIASTDESVPTCVPTLHQAETWPFEISELQDGLPIWIQNGKLAPIAHPSIGISVPTHAHPKAALEAIATLAAEYPGVSNFALVANGVASEALTELRSTIEDNKSRIQFIELPENSGYARGCNVGLQALLKIDSLEYFGVMNDDVLPGADCLYELAYAMEELSTLGHRPGAVGPVSNEVNGPQRVELGEFKDASQMRSKASEYWKTNLSSAHQTLQLRGLLILFTRECLERVGGFDPRFGIGNFEDDDHNLRTTLAGFTLWIASGAFLFHHGSSTFRSLNVDYEANIRRNAELMIRKWNLEKLEDWIAMETLPDGISLFVPFDLEHESAGHLIRINGDSVDLVHQASDIEFAAWIMGHPQTKSPEGRKALIDMLNKTQAAA